MRFEVIGQARRLHPLQSPATDSERDEWAAKGKALVDNIGHAGLYALHRQTERVTDWLGERVAAVTNERNELAFENCRLAGFETTVTFENGDRMNFQTPDLAEALRRGNEHEHAKDNPVAKVERIPWAKHHG